LAGEGIRTNIAKRSFHRVRLHRVTFTVNAGATFRLGASGGGNATGIFNLDGGTLATASGLIGPGGTNNTGTFNFNGGTLQGTANNLTLLGTDLTAVNIRTNGATVSVGTGLNNTISANLLDGGGNGGLTKTGAGNLILSGATGVRINGSFGFGVTPTAVATGYTTFSNLAPDKSCNANATTVDELADILGTLIEDLKAKGIISA
jgi:hypothetical protein